MGGPSLADVGEDELLAQIFPILAGYNGVRGDDGLDGDDGGDGDDGDDGDGRDRLVVGPGDDAAVLVLGSRGGSPAALVVTTDAMVRGRDWRDEWSTGADVGAKVVAQNLADIAAMGARPTGLLVALVADPATPVAWALDLAHGLASAAHGAGCAVIGGDLSSAPAGTLMVSVTALGSLADRDPVLRSGAREGDVLALCGTLGLAAAGWRLLADGREGDDAEAVARQRRPLPPLDQGPAAAASGATSMLDLSDGLLRDAGRIARASGMLLDIDGVALKPSIDRLAGTLGREMARECVLAGGEEHSLLATFASAEAMPSSFRVIGRVRAGSGVAVDGDVVQPRGWDHFGG